MENFTPAQLANASIQLVKAMQAPLEKRLEILDKSHAELRSSINKDFLELKSSITKDQLVLFQNVQTIAKGMLAVVNALAGNRSSSKNSSGSSDATGRFLEVASAQILQLAKTAADLAAQPAQSAPVHVEVTLPPRKSISTIERDANGEMTRVTQLESDADSTAGKSMQYRGIWSESMGPYRPGDFVTDHGSMWACLESTNSRPGKSNAWQMTVKKGRDAR